VELPGSVFSLPDHHILPAVHERNGRPQEPSSTPEFSSAWDDAAFWVFRYLRNAKIVPP
jgi:hypothetical protein